MTGREYDVENRMPRQHQPVGTVVLALGVLATLYVYPLTLHLPLLDPDEGLHASIAQEMVERGDWIQPQFLGEPFLDKAVLYFWVEALALRVFGMSEAAIRFSGLMFGLLGVLTTAAVGWRMFNRNTGLVAGLFYGTMILPLALAQSATPDIALVPWISLALLFFWQSSRVATRRAAAGCVALVGLLLGLTILTKGLTGVAVVGIAYGAYLLVTRRLTLATCGRGLGALIIAAVVAAPWYLALESRHPGYLRYWFIDRHLLGYLTTKQPHGNAAWWYYLPILLGGGLPWVVYLLVLVQDERARWKAAAQVNLTNKPVRHAPSNGAIALLWCWLIGGLLFFTGGHSKLVTYIWPLFPAVALLAAVAWTRMLEGTLSDGARRTLSRIYLGGFPLGSPVLLIAMFVVRHKFSIQFSEPVWLLAILLAGLYGLPAWLWIAQRHRASLSVCLFLIAVQFAFVMTCIVPQVAITVSARELAGHFNRQGRLPDRLLFAGERIGSFVFYLDPQLRKNLRQDQLQHISFIQLQKDDPHDVVVVPRRRIDQANSCDTLAKRPYHLVGQYRVYQFVER